MLSGDLSNDVDLLVLWVLVLGLVGVLNAAEDFENEIVRIESSRRRAASLELLVRVIALASPPEPLEHMRGGRGPLSALLGEHSFPFGTPRV